MTCIGIHRGAGENPFRSWMRLNSMHFASSPALTQAWGGERRFLLRVNAVVCLPARTPLTLSSPFPQPKSQTFSGNSSPLTYLYFIFILKKPIKTKSVEYTFLPTGSKLASQAAPVLRPYQEGVFGGRERGRFCAPQIRRKQPSRPLTRLPAQRTRVLSLRSQPTSDGAGVALAKKCPLHLNFPTVSFACIARPGPPRFSSAVL